MQTAQDDNLLEDIVNCQNNDGMTCLMLGSLFI